MPNVDRARLFLAWSSLVCLLLSPMATAQDAVAPKAKAKAKAPITAKAKSKAKATGRVETPEEGVPPASKGDPDEPEEKPAAKDEEQGEAKRPGLFGDPKRFTKYSGWGSIGGSMGQFGMARTMLVMMPPVQAELKLTDEQKTQVRKWLEGMREQGEQMGRTMREEAGDPALQADMPLPARILQFTTMINRVSEMLRENENGLGRILTKAQRTRLTQIALQMEGIAAVVKPEVAQAINLSPNQYELIQQYLAQARLMQMTTWVEQGIRMDRRVRTERGAAPGATGAARGQRPATGRPADGDDPERTRQAEAMRKEFESMRDRTDSIQEQTVTRILKALSRRQRASFEKLLGEPFDPSQVNTFGPRQDRRAEPESPATPAPEAATKAERQSSPGRGSASAPSKPGTSR